MKIYSYFKLIKDKKFINKTRYKLILQRGKIVERFIKLVRYKLIGDKMAEPIFEIYTDTSGEHRFRLKAPNREIIAVSEGYTTRAACKNGIESVKKNAPIAKIVELD